VWGVSAVVLTGLRRTCCGALLTSAVFMLLLSGAFFPVLDPLLSAAGTLFIGAAGILLRRGAALVYLGAALLTLFVSPRSALEFLLTTGFAGLALGLSAGKNQLFGLAVSSLGMFSGLVLLTCLFGSVTAAAGLAADLPVSACLPVYAVCAPAYCLLWRFVLGRCRKLPMLCSF
jgi:hypothetical protein